MHLSHLDIADFRCLEVVNFEPKDSFNVFLGKNGSGKTSLLEAIHFLGLGRSFRSRSIKHIVRWGCDKFSLFGRTEEAIPIGIERQINGQSHMRLCGKTVQSISEIANVLPLLLIDYRVYQLVDGSPQVRRHFLDWGVFHVKHSEFFDSWRKFNQILKQRNAMLRMSSTRSLKNQIIVWDEPLITLAKSISDCRDAYIQQWLPFFKNILQNIFEERKIENLSVRFAKGWPTEISYENCLASNLDQDIRRGFTQHGPQRADLLLFINKSPISEALSRGEQKLFAVAMKFAQVLLLKQQMQKKCIFLIDDFKAELDIFYTQKIFDFLANLNTQVFLTCTQKEDIGHVLREYDHQLFHVKQGKVSI
jgi:DNA replication and repair protein RecF